MFDENEYAFEDEDDFDDDESTLTDDEKEEVAELISKIESSLDRIKAIIGI